MYYTTSTTTAAPVWASVWACMPEVPATTAADIKSDRKSRAARLLAVLMDYAAGTADSIRTRCRRTAPRLMRAARLMATACRRLVGCLLLLFGCLSSFALFVGLLNMAAPFVPHVFALRLLLVFPAAAIMAAYLFVYLKTFGTIDHCAHLMSDNGTQAPRW